MNSEPIAVAPAEIPTPRCTAALAAGRACSTRHAAAKSGRSRSADHIGGPAPGCGSSARATSADQIACAADEDSTATVRPASCRSATARPRAASTDPLRRGLMSSNAGRSSSSESWSTDTSSASVRCASATTAAASGSCARQKRASTFEPGPLGEMPGTACQPGRRPLFSSISWARFHAAASSPSSAPRRRATRSVSVHSTRGSITMASTRCRWRSASGRSGSTACRSDSPWPSAAAKASGVVRLAAGVVTSSAVAAMSRLRVRPPTSPALSAWSSAKSRAWLSTGRPRGGLSPVDGSARGWSAWRANSGSWRRHACASARASAALSDCIRKPTDSEAGDSVAVSAAATARVMRVSVAGRPMRFSIRRRSQGW